MKTICYVSASSANWGGASRVLFTNLKLIDRKRFRPLILLPAEGPITKELEQLDIPYEIWGKHQEFEGVYSYFKAIIRCMQMFRRYKVDILHFNHASYWKPAEVVAARLMKIPIVTHYHVTIDDPAPWVKYSDAIVAVSEYTAAHSKPEKTPKHVVYNSVDTERFGEPESNREELGLAQDNLVISFVGQIREIKGVDSFIRLAHAIENPNVRFLIVGECRDTDQYQGSYTVERLTREIAGDPRIIYLGYRSDVERIFAATDVLVVPSRWEEPFGLINIEAGASGIPVIASRVGGIPEIITDGENGLLYDADDFGALLGHANQLLDDENLRKRIGARARKIVHERFTHKPLEPLEALYDQLSE